MYKKIIEQWTEDLRIDEKSYWHEDCRMTLRLLKEYPNQDSYHVIVMTMEGVQRSLCTLSEIGEHLSNYCDVYIDACHYIELDPNNASDWVSITIPRTKTKTTPTKTRTKTIIFTNH